MRFFPSLMHAVIYPVPYSGPYLLFPHMCAGNALVQGTGGVRIILVGDLDVCWTIPGGMGGGGYGAIHCSSAISAQRMSTAGFCPRLKTTIQYMLQYLASKKALLHSLGWDAGWSAAEASSSPSAGL